MMLMSGLKGVGARTEDKSGAFSSIDALLSQSDDASTSDI